MGPRCLASEDITLLTINKNRRIFMNNRSLVLRKFNSIFEDSLFNSLENFFPEIFSDLKFEKETQYPFDIYVEKSDDNKEEDIYYIEMALSGFRKEDIKITHCNAKNSYIVVEAGTEDNKEDSERKYLVRRVSSKSTRQLINVPHNSEIGEVSFVNGNLK